MRAYSVDPPTHPPTYPPSYSPVHFYLSHFGSYSYTFLDINTDKSGTNRSGHRNTYLPTYQPTHPPTDLLPACLPACLPVQLDVPGGTISENVLYKSCFPLLTHVLFLCVYSVCIPVDGTGEIVCIISITLSLPACPHPFKVLCAALGSPGAYFRQGE